MDVQINFFQNFPNRVSKFTRIVLTTYWLRLNHQDLSYRRFPEEPLATRAIQLFAEGMQVADLDRPTSFAQTSLHHHAVKQLWGYM
jgi:hypothetical protein